MNKVFASLLTVTLLFINCTYLVTFPEISHANEKKSSSHEHGVGTLNIAIESGRIEIELKVPADDITGFETKPTTVVQKEVVTENAGKLARGAQIFIFPENAECIMSNTEVVSALLENGTVINQQKKKHAHDDHKKHDDESAHSDFSATYRFNCAHTETVKKIDVKFFKFFPSTQKLLVQYITPNKQGGLTLTPTSFRVFLD